MVQSHRSLGNSEDNTFIARLDITIKVPYNSWQAYSKGIVQHLDSMGRH